MVSHSSTINVIFIYILNLKEKLKKKIEMKLNKNTERNKTIKK